MLNPQNTGAQRALDEATTKGSAGPLGARPASADDIPSDTLLALYRQALAREPKNAVLRRAFLDMCGKRGLTCME